MSIDNRLLTYGGYCSQQVEATDGDKQFFEAKQAIYKDLMELIGENKPLDVEQGVSRYDPNGKDMWGNHYADLVNGSIEAKNRLRQELREKVKEYCE